MGGVFRADIIMSPRQVISCQQGRQMMRGESWKALVTLPELVGRFQSRGGIGNQHSCPGSCRVEGELIRGRAIVEQVPK